jgi:hypothetical protein
VRDTTNRAGAVLAVPAATWQRFTSSMVSRPTDGSKTPPL